MAETTSDFLITDEMRAHIGQESEPWTCEVDKSSVRMFARAVGHTDPVYYDEAEAQKAGYRSLPAPPGYLGTPIFAPPAANARAGGRRAGPQPSRRLDRMLNGGTDIEYFADICAGDVLTVKTYVAGYEQRKGSLGEMLITTSKTTYKNQHGDVVAVSTGTQIRY